MTYDLKAIFNVVRETLEQAPLTPLREISSRLRIERHTIEKAIRLVTGDSFRNLRKSIVSSLAINQLAASPHKSIKEICFALGFGSTRTFSRTIKRVCGKPPRELRNNKS
jgi:AraC-like DNA-binding protein